MPILGDVFSLIRFYRSDPVNLSFAGYMQTAFGTGPNPIVAMVYGIDHRLYISDPQLVQDIYIKHAKVLQKSPES